MASHDSKTIEWKLHTLPKATQKALKFLSTQTWLKSSRWYLAGGTALALQAGHRQSVDLDFFNPQKDFSLAKLTARFAQADWEETFLKEATVYGTLLGAKVSFIAYPFFVPKQKFWRYGNVKVLDKKDIAVMKIIAISQRGRKRDFFDLYWYCQNEEPLVDVFQRLPYQYPTVAHDYHHIIKALSFFADAEADPEPKIFFSASWKTVKRYFQAEVKKNMKYLLHIY